MFRIGRKPAHVASKAGYGFVLVEDDAVACEGRAKQVLTVEGQGAALSIRPKATTCVIGDNGKSSSSP